MKFIIAKHTLSCRHCRGEITPGDLFCRTFHRNKQTGATFGFCYHYDCYIIDYVERIRRSALYWQGQQVPPKKKGRPVKSSNPKEYRRLKALQRYHRKAGNEDRVVELEARLEELLDKT